MIDGSPPFVEFRLEPRENRVEHTELGTIVVSSRVDDVNIWTATIRALDPSGARFLGGGHHVLLEPLGNTPEPSIVARLTQSRVVIRDLSNMAYRVRFTPRSSQQAVAGASRAAFGPSASSGWRSDRTRWYRAAADPRVQLRVQEDGPGSTVDVYVDRSSVLEIVIVLRGQKHRVTLSSDGERLHGSLEVGYPVGDDLYVGTSR